MINYKFLKIQKKFKLLICNFELSIKESIDIKRKNLD